jgi:DNA-binding NtrC family response regulator
VLIVDDRELLRTRLAFALRARGLHAFESGGARSALAAFEREAPDAVVADTLRLRPDALALLERIRSHSYAPLFSIGAHPDWGCVQQTTRIGPTYFYCLPRDLVRLIDHVAATLSEGSRATAPRQAPSARQECGRREMVEWALLAASGSILEAARLLGVSRLTLYRWIARYEIGREDPTAPVAFLESPDAGRPGRGEGARDVDSEDGGVVVRPGLRFQLLQLVAGARGIAAARLRSAGSLLKAPFSDARD